MLINIWIIEIRILFDNLKKNITMKFDSTLKALLLALFHSTCILAQEGVYKLISSEKPVKAYPAVSYENLSCNLLPKTDLCILSDHDIRQLNGFIQLAESSYRHPFRKCSVLSGLFIEQSVSGIYLTRKGFFEVTADNYIGEGKRFPRDVQERVDSFIRNISNRCPRIHKYISYDQNPMTSHVKLGVIYPPFVHKEWVDVVFYVDIDSVKTIPIKYSLVGGRRIKQVARTIPFWKYYSENYQGRGWEPRTYLWHSKRDEELIKILSKWFPSWPQMTDQERMRMLDNIIINQLNKSDKNK